MKKKKKKEEIIRIPEKGRREEKQRPSLGIFVIQTNKKIKTKDSNDSTSFKLQQ
jgi:hypothetical protein